MIKKLVFTTAAVGIFLSLAVVAMYLLYPRAISSASRFAFQKVISFVGKNAPYENKYGLHPVLYSKVDSMITEAKKQGIDLRIISGYRSPEHQKRLYAQGRTSKGHIVTNAPPGFSFHNYGFAVDVCEFVNGKPHWNSSNWNLVGELGKEQGLVWGGDWKTLVDKPHFQLTLKDIILIMLHMND